MVKFNFKTAVATASILAITIAAGGLVLSQGTTPTGAVKGTSTNVPSQQQPITPPAPGNSTHALTETGSADITSPATSSTPADQRVGAKRPAASNAVAVVQAPVETAPTVPAPVVNAPATPTFHLTPRVDDAWYSESSYNFGGQQYTYQGVIIPVDLTYDEGFNYMTTTSFDCDILAAPGDDHGVTCGAGQKEAGVIRLGFSYTDDSPLGVYEAGLTVRIGEEVKTVQIIFELAPETETADEV